MNKFVSAFVLCLSLMFAGTAMAGTVKKPPVLVKYDLQAGDILAVTVNLGGKDQIIFVMVQADWTMDYVYAGKIYPFPAADLEEYQWVLFERTEL